jgi:hypothetical protein
MKEYAKLPRLMVWLLVRLSVQGLDVILLLVSVVFSDLTSDYSGHLCGFARGCGRGPEQLCSDKTRWRRIGQAAGGISGGSSGEQYVTEESDVVEGLRRAAMLQLWR